MAYTTHALEYTPLDGDGQPLAASALANATVSLIVRLYGQLVDEPDTPAPDSGTYRVLYTPEKPGDYLAEWHAAFTNGTHDRAAHEFKVR